MSYAKHLAGMEQRCVRACVASGEAFGALTDARAMYGTKSLQASKAEHVFEAAAVECVIAGKETVVARSFTCPGCGGDGVVPNSGVIPSESPCRACQGTGRRSS